MTMTNSKIDTHVEMFSNLSIIMGTSDIFRCDMRPTLVIPEPIRKHVKSHWIKKEALEVSLVNFCPIRPSDLQKVSAGLVER
jgi:hypothetical protein